MTSGTSRWLAERLGCAGASAARIKSDLSAGLPYAPVPLEEFPGLPPPALEALAAEHGFAALASAFPSRGSAERLSRIAWMGSALADVFYAGTDEGRGRVLRIAGAFNVAVALFDTVIDEHPERSGALSRALHPAELDRMLRSSPRCADDEGSVGGLVGLFQRVLRELSLVFARDRALVSAFSESLTAMYRSEVLGLPNRLRAKTLPITFIGQISSGAPAATDFHESMAELLALVDDWIDLPADMHDGKANVLIGDPSPGTLGETIAYRWRCVRMVARARQTRQRVRDRLLDALTRVLLQARRSGPETSTKTIRFLNLLLRQGCRPAGGHGAGQRERVWERSTSATAAAACAVENIRRRPA